MDNLKLSKNVLVFITNSDPWNWPQHPEDAEIGRKKFIVYIGLDDKTLLQRIIKLSPYPINATLRKGQRLKYRWELKIQGLSWDDAEAIAYDLDRLFP
jgi:hypothetical protein